MLNPMNFHPRFQHIVENILKHLDIKSLKYGRQVSKMWQSYIDNKNLLRIREVNYLGPKRAFHFACGDGNWKMVEFLIQNPTKYDID